MFLNRIKEMFFDLNGKLQFGWGTFLAASFVLALIPTYIWFIPPFMILWVLFWILENIQGKNRVPPGNRYSLYLFILFTLFYLWQSVGILYSDDKKYAINMFFGRLSLFLFPLVLFMPGRKLKENGFLLLQIFSIGTSIFILSCFGYAMFNSVSFDNGIRFNPHPQQEYWMNYFYGSLFSINQHPSYLAMYVILSGFVSFESGLDLMLSKRKRIFLWLNGIFLFIALYFISSRAALVAVPVLIPLYVFLKIGKQKKLAAVIVVFFLLITFFAIRTNERVRISINENSIESFVKKDGRISIWNSAIQVIKENILIGVGIGDTRAELMKVYKQSGNQDLILNNYNAHNQYLEILLENGIVGAGFFLGILLLMLFIAIYTRNHLLGIFILMMMIFFLFETVLNRLQGVAFFSIFSFLLIQTKPIAILKT